MALQVQGRVVSFHIDLRIVWVLLVFEPALPCHTSGWQRCGGEALGQRTKHKDLSESATGLDHRSPVGRDGFARIRKVEVSLRWLP